jgi:ceramide glucosyltransferase
MMTTLIWSAGTYCLLTASLHFSSLLIAVRRCRAGRAYQVPPAQAAGVTVIRPVCGIDNHAEDTLRSTFELDYPHCEILFCVAQSKDPVVGLLQRLMAAHPHVPAALLTGDDPVSDNPKLNNVVKGWRQAAFDWVVIADSNVLMPRDYIQRLLATFTPGTGLVCSPPVGCSPEGLWAELECSFLNSYQARWQYVADSLGVGFAQGKTMLWRREILEAGGGIRALGAELAEDAAATKLVRKLGLRVRLVDAPFGQPLGSRTAAEIWRRQLRWARLRRATFKAFFIPEILVGGIGPIIAAACVAAATGVSVVGVVFALALAWYGGEVVLARAAGWPLNLRAPFVFLLRDLLLPALWVHAWSGSSFVWRGTHMHLAGSGTPG